MQRFATHSVDDILAKRANIIPKNTSKSNNVAARALRDYLVEKKQDSNFENFDAFQLSETLQHFYMDARSKKGDLYKATTFINLRHGLNRYLKAPPIMKRFDIITSPAFSDANECFKTALGEIKQAGKGDVTHFEQISNSDLSKIYNSLYLSPATPCGLFNRVQMNIRLFFCRRANENMEHLRKDSFVIKQYPDGRKYVVKRRDELTKNHRAGDFEGFSGHMPADMVGSDYCPVRNFETYLRKLHPASDRLWQYPKDSFSGTSDDDEIWYQNRPVGRDSLAKFMPKLSEKIPLEKRYTNHSIRVTGTTILSRVNFSPSQIMAVTGHKSVSSLSVYQRSSDSEKMAMGDAIGGSLNTAVVPFAQRNVVVSAEPPASASAQICSNFTQAPGISTNYTDDTTDSNLQIDGIALSDLFSDFPMPAPRNNTNSYTQQTLKNMPLFSGCTIQSVVVNINKNN